MSPLPGRWRDRAVRALAVELLIACTACVPSTTLEARFDANASRYVLETGANTIIGHASLISRNGHVRTCKFDGVLLIPTTAYSSERMSVAFGNTNGGYTRWYSYESLPDNDQYEKFSRHAECDEAGSFMFKDVADGEYFVLSKITWWQRWSHGGGYLMKRLSVADHQHKEIALEAKLAY
jgi:hypothetical protein